MGENNSTFGFQFFKKKIVFIIDNCPAHYNILHANSIELVFLPPYSASVFKPLDQGVIQNIKTNYRMLLFNGMISVIDKNEKNNVLVLDALFDIDDAWNNASRKTISYCFRLSQF